LSDLLIQRCCEQDGVAMARQVTWLSDVEWARIEPLLPRGRKGAHRVDGRRVISGIVHMLRIGAPWRTCSPEYGRYTTVYNRFNRWSRHRASGWGCSRR
jgi:transposase